MRLGCFLLALAVIPFLLMLRYDNSRHWTAVSVPFSVSASHVTRANFTVDLNATYWVEIELERKLPFETIKGLGCPPVEWAVWQNNKSIGREYSGEGWSSDTVEYDIGTFKGIVRQKYSIEAHVKQNAPAFRELQPRLIVFVSPVDSMAITQREAGLILVSMVEFILSMCCFVSAWREGRT